MMKAITTALALSLLFAANGPATAHEIKFGQLVITHPWIMQSQDQATAFGCMKITNNSATDDLLIAVVVNPHTSAHLVEVSTKGVSPGGSILIPAWQTVHIHPNAAHMAVIALPSPLLEGSEVSGSLIFQKAGRVDIDYEVGD